MASPDCVVIGAGVVGLSLAYELSGQGMRVHVLERGTAGQEASWAGAGILPAAVPSPPDRAYQQLSGLSVRLHAQWAPALLAETGIDNGYRRCGEIYLARSDVQAAQLKAEMGELSDRGVQVVPLAPRALAEREPALAERAGGPLPACFHLPGSAQLRNPRHLQALVAACRKRGVQLSEQTVAEGVDIQQGRLRQLHTSAGSLRAENYCFTAGAWSGSLVELLGVQLPVKPMRGQMVLLKTPTPQLRSAVHEGPCYLVPRDDGRVLVGTTLEDVGFDKRTTAAAIVQLLDFASAIMPALSSAEMETCWAGLRPDSPRGMPYVGRVPGLENAFVATGHFRWGLWLSPATAVVLSELVRGRTPQIDLTPFRLDRDQ
ncbi:MAG: glycine oxidase ThiO [Planctomycetales bacterium]|nr:glycine oxidase ThiO [Planctomycetales bacterium]